METNLMGTYEERLATLKMRTVEDRRVRGDLIETFKILTGKSDVDLNTWFTLAKEKEGTVSTRAATGHLNLVQPPCGKGEIRRNFYSHRVVPLWNLLPDHVKMAKNTNEFKNSYDKFTGY